MSKAEMLTDGFSKSEQARSEHESNTKIALERIEALLDSGSFAELNAFVPDTRLAAGYGSVDGRLVFVYSQQGEIGLAHAKKIAGTIISAIKVGAPVIGIHDSNGIRLEEGLDCLEAFSVIFAAQSEASGVILQISVIPGDCMGTNALIPALSDFRFSIDKSKYFFASPDTYTGFEPGTSVKASENGLVDFCFASEEALNAEIKKLLSYLPSNCHEAPPMSVPTDDMNREDSALDGLSHRAEDMVSGEINNKQIDVMKVIESITDNGQFIEVKKGFANNIRVGFMRIGGRTAGFVANNGALSADAIEKNLDFITLCDSYSIPIINIIDASKFEDKERNDRKIIRTGARLIHAYAQASVPKISVIVANAVGASYLLMNGGYFSADVVYAWPEANIAPINKEASKEIFNYEQETSALSAASKGYVHDIIIPAATRKRLISALEMLDSKRVSRLTKKHGVLV